ncbi:hypothetical protein LTR66_010047 [Elasticomyces elasticus]|nr:hypothetical protein LTR66_010047 [Elasticomyces elasticus]
MLAPPPNSSVRPSLRRGQAYTQNQNVFTDKSRLQHNVTPEVIDAQLAALAVEKRPLCTTIGIEFEFVLLIQANDPPGRNMDSHAFRLPLNDLLHDLDPATQYMKWTVKNDPTPHLSARQSDALPGDWGFARMELVSRVFSYHHQTQDDDWRWEVRQVLARLHERLNDPAAHPGFRVIINSSCGCHVHVGNGVRGFPVRTVRKVLSFFTVFERVIDTITNTSRIGGESLHEDAEGDGWYHPVMEPTDDHAGKVNVAYNQPLSSRWIERAKRHRRRLPDLDHSCFEASEDAEWTLINNPTPSSPRLRPVDNATLEPISDHEQASDHKYGAFDIIHWVMILQEQDTITALREQYFNHHTTTVNIENLLLVPGQEGEKNTIEFRQYQATLDADETLAYVDLLVSAVEHCHSTTLPHFLDLVLQTWSNPAFSIADLLAAVHAPASARRFYAHHMRPSTAEECGNELVRREDGATPRQPSELRRLVAEVAVEHMQLRAAASMRKHISWKLRRGGYGRFPAGFWREIFSERWVDSLEGRRLTLMPGDGGEGGLRGVEMVAEGDGLGEGRRCGDAGRRRDEQTVRATQLERVRRSRVARFMPLGNLSRLNLSRPG